VRTNPPTLCLLKHKRNWNQLGCRLQSFITFKKLGNDYIQAVAKFYVSRFREMFLWKKSEAICLQFSGNLQCKQILHVENRGFNTNDAVVFSIRQKEHLSRSMHKLLLCACREQIAICMCSLVWCVIMAGRAWRNFFGF